MKEERIQGRMKKPEHGRLRRELRWERMQKQSPPSEYKHAEGEERRGDINEEDCMKG